MDQLSDNSLDDDAGQPSDAFDSIGDSGDIDSPATRDQPAFVEQFVGVIRSMSCSGGSDYTDARYFVDRAIPNQSLKGSDLLAAGVDTLPGIKRCMTATNLAELIDGTHWLAAGTLVQVFSLYTRGRPSAKLHVFNLPPRSPAVVVKISSAASGAGEYNGAILAGTSNASPSTDLAMPVGLSVPDSDDALVLNVEEDSISGHRLASGSYVVGVVKGYTSESPSRKIVVARGGVGRLDSPTTLGGTSEGSESADSSTWSKVTNGTPLNVYMVSRTVYNESGDKTLYQFVRELTFDARGVLSAVGAETRVTIDVTESCP